MKRVFPYAVTGAWKHTADVYTTLSSNSKQKFNTWLKKCRKSKKNPFAAEMHAQSCYMRSLMLPQPPAAGLPEDDELPLFSAAPLSSVPGIFHFISGAFSFCFFS